VAVKTLRFYEEIGLFKPLRKNPLTRYREYDPGQLSDIASILALRELGLSLEEVKSAKRRSTPAGWRALLQQIERELRQSIEASSRSLRWVVAELCRIDGPVGPSVILRRRPAIEVASLRATLGASTDVIELDRQLLALVPKTCRGVVRGTLWHRCPDGIAGAEVEQFVEIVRPPPLRNGLSIGRLPAITAACAYSPDDEDASRSTFAEVRRWMTARGYELALSKRELYWPGRLEIQFPIAL
jgi:DNA-binding transcriptional MerR regulator